MVVITSDDFIVSTKLTIQTTKNEELKINGYSFFKTILEFIGKGYSEESYKRVNFNNIAGENKFHLKCVCITELLFLLSEKPFCIFSHQKNHLEETHSKFEKNGQRKSINKSLIQETTT